MDKAYFVPNPVAPTQCVVIDSEKCVACNRCAAICRMQTIMPNPEKGKPPIVLYPDECWFCGSCIEQCNNDAIRMNYPINQRIFFKHKKTGEVFRVGGPEAPAQSYFPPTVGDNDLSIR